MPPAARITDPTAHGAPLAPGPGSPNVLIGGLPAWRTVIDQHACPAVSVSGADGVGAVMMGSPTVLINNQMACRQGDVVVEKPGLAMGPHEPYRYGLPDGDYWRSGHGRRRQRFRRQHERRQEVRGVLRLNAEVNCAGCAKTLESKPEWLVRPIRD